MLPIFLAMLFLVFGYYYACLTEIDGAIFTTQPLPNVGDGKVGKLNTNYTTNSWIAMTINVYFENTKSHDDIIIQHLH